MTQAAFRDFEADDACKVAVLYGDGGTFCSGADLHAVASGGERMNALVDVNEGDGPMGPSRMVHTVFQDLTHACDDTPSV